MSFDATQPTNTTKIRNLGTVIRPNWQAIEEATSSFTPIGVNYSNRNTNPKAATDDPAAIADAYIVYCKEDTPGNPELYGIDASGVISQFTSRERTLAETGFALIPPGFLLQWGRDNMVGSGTVITFPEPYSANAWVVTVTPYSNTVTGSTPKPFGVTLITDIDFKATALNGTGASPVAFGWMAIGPV